MPRFRHVDDVTAPAPQPTGRGTNPTRVNTDALVVTEPISGKALRETGLGKTDLGKTETPRGNRRDSLRLWTADRVAPELARVAAGRSRLRSRDLPPALYRQALRCFGSLRRALEASGVMPDDRRPRRWTRERVLSELRDLHARGQGISARDIASAGRFDLLSAAQRYTRGLEGARRLAGLPAPPGQRRGEPVTHDEDSIIEEILRRHASGETLAHSKAPVALVVAARRRFGTWAQAVEAAGLDYQAVRLVRAPYTRDELLAELRSLATAHPEFRLTDFHEKPLSRLAHRVQHFFGSFLEAARAAGIEGWPRPSRATALLGRVEVGRRLRQRARLGQPVSATAVAREDGHLWQSVRRHHASWKDALKGAGLSAHAIAVERWTRQSVLAALEARAREGGDSLAPRRVRREANPLYQAARRHFGSYLAAARLVEGEGATRAKQARLSSGRRDPGHPVTTGQKDPRSP